MSRIANYELSVLIKSKGFNEYTFDFYVDPEFQAKRNNLMADWNCDKGKYAAPKLNDLSDYMLNKYKAHIEINTLGNNKFKWIIRNSVTGRLMLEQFKANIIEPYDDKYDAMQDAAYYFFNLCI